MSNSDDSSATPGIGKNGRPYKPDNVRDDGSYINGKGRAPEHGKFRKNDGRTRGKREKGSKNVASIWSKQLSRKLTLNGETKTAAEWLVDAMIRRGISRSDRAAEKALEQGERLDRTRQGTVIGREDEVIAAYMAQRLAELGVQISEDEPEMIEIASSEKEEGPTDADQ